MKVLSFPIIAVIAVIATAPSAPASPLPDDGESYLTLYFDNDVFHGSDDDYTNGFRLSWTSDNRPVDDIGGVQHWLRYLIGDESSIAPFQRVSGFDDASDIIYSYGFSLTQLMFTPDDPDVASAILDDRPYAGVLLLGFSLHAMDRNVLNTAALSVGTVGRHAFAEETQDFFHSIGGQKEYKGWKHQVPNEPLLNIHLSQKRRLSLLDYQNGHFAIDGYTEIAIGLGNYRTEAQLGALVRIGYNLPVEFSDPRLSAQSYTHKLFQNGRVLNSKWSLYAMFGVRGYAVAHDVTLDGPIFRGGFQTDVRREPWVGEAFAGFGVRLSDWELSYIHTFHTREYDLQGGDVSFGSVAIRKKF